VARNKTKDEENVYEIVLVPVIIYYGVEVRQFENSFANVAMPCLQLTAVDDYLKLM
jgi:hypothetical protein